MTTLCFMDTETTSLRHDRRIWEIALIIRTFDQPDQSREFSWLIDANDLDLGNADLNSLNIGRFYQRHPHGWAARPRTSAWTESAVLARVEELTRGATIIGAVPNFDTEVLGQRMRAHGLCPSWHYHLVDVETLAAGALRQAPPWNFDELLTTYDLAYKEEDRHTALGDARMVRDLYDAVLNPGASDDHK